MSLFGPPDVAKLLEKGHAKGLLKALVYPKETAIRAEAADALGELGDVSTVGALIDAMSTDDLEVATRAACALARFDVEEARAALREGADSLSDRVRQAACLGLGFTHAPVVFEVLEQALGDDDIDVRVAAIRGLAELGGERASKAIVEVLGKHPKTNKTACEVLDRFGEAAVNHLVERLFSGNRVSRRAAAEALDILGWTPQGERDGPAYWIAKGQYEQCVAFGGMAVESLCQVLQSSDREQYAEVAKTLGKIADERAVEALIGILSSDKKVRKEAVNALVRIGEAAVEPVKNLLSSQDKLTRESAVTILGEMGWSPQSSEEELVFRTAARDIEGLNDLGEQAIPTLKELLGDGSASIRRRTADVLAELGNYQVVEDLVARLDDTDLAVRRAVVGALERLGWQPTATREGAFFLVAKGRYDECLELGEAAVEPLLDVLESTDTPDLLSVIRVLGEIGAERVGEALAVFLEEGTEEVIRSTAALALAKIGDPRHLEKLLAAFNQLQEPDLRTKMAEALGSWALSRVVEIWLGGTVDVQGDLVTHLQRANHEAFFQALSTRLQQVPRDEGWFWRRLETPDPVKYLAIMANDQIAILTRGEGEGELWLGSRRGGWRAVVTPGEPVSLLVLPESQRLLVVLSDARFIILDEQGGIEEADQFVHDDHPEFSSLVALANSPVEPEHLFLRTRVGERLFVSVDGGRTFRPTLEAKLPPMVGPSLERSLVPHPTKRGTFCLCSLNPTNRAAAIILRLVDDEWLLEELAVPAGFDSEGVLADLLIDLEQPDHWLATWNCHLIASWNAGQDWTSLHDFSPHRVATVRLHGQLDSNRLLVSAPNPALCLAILTIRENELELTGTQQFLHTVSQTAAVSHIGADLLVRTLDGTLLIGTPPAA